MSDPVNHPPYMNPVALADLPPTMPALTLTQPWATLVAIGEKKIETRSWQRAYRGPIAIHAASGFPAWAKALCTVEPFCSSLKCAGFHVGSLPTGVMVAVCDLRDIVPTRYLRRDLSPKEEAFGDYSGRRFGWMLDNVREIEEPYPIVQGALGIWTWDRALNSGVLSGKEITV